MSFTTRYSGGAAEVGVLQKQLHFIDITLNLAKNRIGANDIKKETGKGNRESLQGKF